MISVTKQYNLPWNYSLDKVNSDVKVIHYGEKLHTDLCIKPADTRQYVEFSSCHVCHSKKSIPYSQAHRFNSISENKFFANRCNQLGFWLKDRGYNQNFLDNKFWKQGNLPGKI